MDLKQLRYFVAVAEERHFGRAAERLHIVQPALSMQIKALEEALGGPLLTRTTRQVELTEAGKTLLEEARRTLAQADFAATRTRSALRGEIGRLRLGFVGNAVLTGVLIEHLRHFRRGHEAVEIPLQEASPEVLVDKLQNAELDLAYVSHTVAPPGLEARPIRTDTVVAVMAKGHPLDAPTPLDPAELAGQPLLIYGGDNPARLQELKQLGLTALSQTHLPSTLSVLAAAAAGFGIAIGPSELARIGVPGLSYRPIPALQGLVALSLLWRKGDSNGALHAYLDSAQAVAQAATTQAH